MKVRQPRENRVGKRLLSAVRRFEEAENTLFVAENYYYLRGDPKASEWPGQHIAMRNMHEGTCTCLPLSQAVRVKYLGSSVK